MQVEGRTYPVDLHYLPPLHEDEELAAHVARAVDWLDTLDDRGTCLSFFPANGKYGRWRKNWKAAG